MTRKSDKPVVRVDTGHFASRYGHKPRGINMWSFTSDELPGTFECIGKYVWVMRMAVEAATAAAKQKHLPEVTLIVQP